MANRLNKTAGSLGGPGAFDAQAAPIFPGMKSSYLLLNDLRVHYLHWNLESAGRPVLLLHGLASNARIWELTAPYLIQAGLVPIAPDARGHGLTDQPDGDYSFDTFRRDLLAIIDALNLENPLLAGHSWGANLALDYAAHFSFGPRSPAGIVLVDGGMTQLDDDGASWESTRDRLTPPKLAGTPLEDFLEQLRAAPGWQPDEAAIPPILANFVISEDDTLSPRLSFDHHMQIVRSLWEFPTYERFGLVRCPVMMAPALSPEPKAGLAEKQRGVARAGEKIRHLQVHWMPDTGHDIPLQRPQDLGAAIAAFASSL